MSGHGIEYRPYQIEARDAVFGEFDQGRRSTLVVMPTGTGKTVLAGMICEEAIRRGERVLFVAHREILINQAFNTMGRFGFECAVEMGSRDASKHIAACGHPDVIVGSVQTLQGDRLMRWPSDYFQKIIIDECHRAHADSYTKLLNWFEGYQLLGITATPRRGDNRNLGARFQTKAYEYSLRRAISEGWLVPIRTRECQVSVDLRGIKMAGGDFSVEDLSERISPKLEQLARAFLWEAGFRPSVVFTPDVASATLLAELMNQIGAEDGSGRQARYVAGQGGQFGMSKAEQKANLDAFNSDEYQIITCCELLIEGWDCPKVEAVGIMRPTTKQYRYTQMVGRTTRPSLATHKKDCLVVDFDWQADREAKDLCSTVELFDDGSIDEEVFAVARVLAAERAVETDPLEVIEEAEQIIRTQKKFLVKLTGKEAKYEALTYDPVGVAKILDFKLNRKYDLDRSGSNPASEKQIGMLKGLGISVPSGLSKWGASKMIGKILKRKEQGLATVNQVQALLCSGVRPDVARSLSASEASDAIRELTAMKPKSQGKLFA